MSLWDHMARTPDIRRRMKNSAVKGFPHGLNTLVSEMQIAKTEAAELINFKINPGGQLESRQAISRHTNTAVTGNAAIKAAELALLGSTAYELQVDANHRLYYLDGNLDPQLIGTLAGAAQILPYNGVAVLLDGSYAKYVDDTSAIKICYDAGDGTSGYQFDNSAGTDDVTLKLGDGTNTRIATVFTAQTWTSGYTIPPTRVQFKLSAAGTPNASAVTARIRAAGDDSILAEKVLVADASTLTGTAAEETVSFVPADVTTEMSPATDYYCSIEHSGGDGSNHVLVHCTTVASGGTGAVYAGSWAADTTKDPIASLRPGRPPKIAFGYISDNRIFAGGDPDNPGWVRFCNLTHLDWSTANGGGYVGAVDDDRNNFPVGGICDLYGDLFVFGKEDQPYICKLTGDTPSDYALKRTFQKVWTTHNTLVSSVNDLWAGSGNGVNALAGVQEYGDLRAESESDPVADRIAYHWATPTAVAGYNPLDGQYWLAMPAWRRVLVARTKKPVRSPDGMGLRYPWTEYELLLAVYTSSAYKWTKSANGTNEYYVELAAGGDPSIAAAPDFLTRNRVPLSSGTLGALGDRCWGHGDNDGNGFPSIYLRDDSGDPDSTGVAVRGLMVPTCFTAHSGTFFMGGSDGHLYKIDTGEYKDQGTCQIDPRLRSAYIEFPYVYAEMERFQHQFASRGGAGSTVAIYTDGQLLTPTHSFSMPLAIADDLTLAEATMDLEDAQFTLAPVATAVWADLYFNARSFQVQLVDLTLAGWPLFINGWLVMYRPLSA